jgi:hypothetical protein
MTVWRALHAALAFAFVGWVLAVGPSTDAMAQPADTPPTREQLEVQIDILKDQLKRSQALVERLQQENAREAVEPALLEAYAEAQKQQYDMWKKQSEYTAAILDWNIRSMERQRFAYGVILFLVALVVIAGTAFSGFQLWKSSVTGVHATNDFEVSASKIRVTSSVVGLIVLTISLVFLYIYTKEIYQVRVVDVSKSLPAAKSGD